MKVVVDKARKTVSLDELPDVVVGLHEVVSINGVRNAIARLKALAEDEPRLTPELILDQIETAGYAAGTHPNQAIAQVRQAISARVIDLGVSVALEALANISESAKWDSPHWLAVVEPLRSAGLSAQEILIKLQHD